MNISPKRRTVSTFHSIHIFVLCSLLVHATGCGKIIFLRDPLSAREHAELASVYEEQGQYDIAIREAEYAVKQDPINLKALIALGNSHLHKGNYKGAEKYYSRALDIDPENPDILNNMAWMYMSTKRLDRAEEYARRAIALDSPNKGYYYDTLGKIYERMEDAGEAFERAKALTTVPPFLK